MSKILLAAILLCNTFTANAQWLTKPKKNGKLPVRYFINIGGIYNYNKPDVPAAYSNVLTMRDNGSWYVGGNMLLTPSRSQRFLMDAALGIKLIRQQYSFVHNPATNGHRVNEQLTYTYDDQCVYLNIRIAPGYSFRLSANTRIDLTTGLSVDVLTNPDDVYREKGLFVKDGSTGYNIMPAYISTGNTFTGNNTEIQHSDVAINALADLQVAYRVNKVGMLWRKRDCRVGIGFSRFFNGNGVYSTSITTFDAQRKAKDRYWLRDKYVSMMVFAGITL